MECRLDEISELVVFEKRLLRFSVLNLLCFDLNELRIFFISWAPAFAMLSSSTYSSAYLPTATLIVGSKAEFSLMQKTGEKWCKANPSMIPDSFSSSTLNIIESPRECIDDVLTYYERLLCFS